MNLFSVVALLALAAVVSAGSSEEVQEASNAQNGHFFLYKVKPRTQAEVFILKRSYEAFAEHSPIFLQEVHPLKSVLLLIEQSKVHVLDELLKKNNIKHWAKGITLVDSISTRRSTYYYYEPNSTDNATCDCDYHSGGCMISKAPPLGHACKCIYKGAWTCRGVAFSCDPGQHCPANCTSLSCCHTGRGDCGGY